MIRIVLGDDEIATIPDDYYFCDMGTCTVYIYGDEKGKFCPVCGETGTLVQGM